MTVTLLEGDCREQVAALPSNSVDAVVTDPPYALVSITKRFGADDAAPARSNGPSGVYARAAAGFMGKQWDTGEVAFDPAFWSDVMRVLKPGGHVLAFGGTRTVHRLTVAIEDAGFEIRDMIAWVYGSGFPKSLDVSKAIESGGGRPEDIRRMQMGEDYAPSGRGRVNYDHGVGSAMDAGPAQWSPATDAARQWSGWGTALKPALEPITVARKPLVGTVAANVLAYGTGALNVDGCRVHAEDAQGGTYTVKRFAPGASVNKDGAWKQVASFTGEMKPGRWPANLVHDGSAEATAAFPQAPGQLARARTDGARKTNAIYGALNHVRGTSTEPRGDTGSAARFFYCAKASKADRAGSKHPTVKPIALMRYLCRLVTPPGGVVLDPFAGSGTTGAAALAEGFRPILIEREAEYVADIRRRLGLDALEDLLS